MPVASALVWCFARPARVLSALVLATALASCARTRSEELAPVERGPVGLEVVAEGPWREIPVDQEAAFQTPATQRVVVERPRPPRPARSDASEARPTAPKPRSLAILPRRGAPPPSRLPDGKPMRPRKSPEAQKRDRYLDHPTRIRAERISFYCPAALAPSVQLTGASVETKKPTKRVAMGRARLLCRELTLEAERITLTVRGEDPDVQITARGNVHFVTQQKAQVLREEGVRSLLITNEQLVPLR